MSDLHISDLNFITLTDGINLSPYFYSLPFPAAEDDDEDDEEGGGGGDRQDRHGQGKGLSREQKEGLDMIKHVMLSLDEEDGLDQIYTFRCFFIYILIQLSYTLCLPFI